MSAVQNKGANKDESRKTATETNSGKPKDKSRRSGYDKPTRNFQQYLCEDESLYSKDQNTSTTEVHNLKQVGYSVGSLTVFLRTSNFTRLSGKRMPKFDSGWKAVPKPMSRR